MLISFNFGNWKSFKQEACFHTIADDTISFEDSKIYHIKDYDAHILPVSAIYGGNASGKTNFFQALSFVKEFVVKININSKINVIPFRLDEDCENDTSYFGIVLYTNGSMYQYEFIVDTHEVIAEGLTKLSANSGIVLYNREDHKITFDNSIKDQDLLNLVFSSTRQNQLFLQACRITNIDAFNDIYNWFLDSLEIIYPSDLFIEFLPVFNNDSHYINEINSILSEFDTSVEEIITEKYTGKNPYLFIPLDFLDKPVLDSNEGKFFIFTNPLTKEKFILTKENSELALYNIFSVHTNQQGHKRTFAFSDESQGTSRLFDLLPVFTKSNKYNQNKVFVIDELDRSLHPNLLKSLLRLFIKNCNSESGPQLIFNCQDVQLLDLDFLRRDQFWVVDKNLKNESSLVHFTEFKDAHTDNDIRFSYLHGKLGGIPNIN